MAGATLIKGFAVGVPDAALGSSLITVRSELGQKAKYSLRADVFRCSPDIGHSARARVRAC
jgi:hypothetical protein